MHAHITHKVGTAFGWVATVGGMTQLAFGKQIMAISGITGEHVSTFLVQLGPGVTAFSGVAILAYQQWHAMRRKELVEDDKVLAGSWKTRVDLLESQIEELKKKNARIRLVAERYFHAHRRLLKKLKAIEDKPGKNGDKPGETNDTSKKEST